MKIKRILAAALAAMTLGLTITGCSNNGGNGSTEDDTIVIGLDVGFAPMGFEQDGEIVGFDIDLARAVIEDKMGKNVEFQPIDWNSKEGELNTGKVDLLWNGLSRSPEREENMALTNSYLKNDQILVVKSDSGITSSADITGKVLAMQEGSTAEDAWDTFSEEHTDIVPSTVNLLSDNVVCLTELEQDKADVVLMDSVVAEYYLSTNDEYSNLTILDDVPAKSMRWRLPRTIPNCGIRSTTRWMSACRTALPQKSPKSGSAVTSFIGKSNYHDWKQEGAGRRK